MKKVFAFTVLVALALFVLQGCKRSKKEILTGIWGMEISYVNGVREKEDYPLTLHLNPNGTFRQIIEYPYKKEDVNGTWMYNDEKSRLVLHYTYTGTDVEWTIVTFEENRMELNHKTPGFFVERTFVKTN